MTVEPPPDRDVLVAAAARTLHPLPVSACRLAVLLTRDTVETAEVEDIVRHDQALTFRLLRMANSAASGSVRPVVTVRDAVVRLGPTAVHCVAAGAGLQQQLSQALPDYQLLEGELWRHSVASALAAQIITARHAAAPPESSTAALLHDIGKLVLTRSLGKTLKWRFQLAASQGAEIRTVERELLGLDHAELGGLIAGHWNLPERLARGIAFHHTPALGDDPVCDVVHVANAIAKDAVPRRVAVDRSPHDRVDTAAFRRLGLSWPDVLDATETVRGQIDGLLARYATVAPSAI